MYSGITRGVFPVTAVERRPGAIRFSVQLTPELVRDISLGASVGVDGVCLTVVAYEASQLSFEIIEETQSRTTLADVRVGRGVSIERSCRVGDELGGHDVFGHVIGTGKIVAAQRNGDALDLTIGVPRAWMKFILHKGFIALDGSSLTIGDVSPEGRFDVHLIPETLRVTNFAHKSVGDAVNVELDARTVAIVETVERVLAEREKATE